MTSPKTFWDDQPPADTPESQKRWLEWFVVGAPDERSVARASTARNYARKLLSRQGIPSNAADDIAEEITHECYYRVYRRIDRDGCIDDPLTDHTEALRKYSFTVIRNLVMDRGRHAERYPQALIDDSRPDQRGPADEAEGFALIELSGGGDPMRALLAEVNRRAERGEMAHRNGSAVGRNITARVNSTKVWSVALGIVARVSSESSLEDIGALAGWDGRAYDHWLPIAEQDIVVAVADPDYFDDCRVSENARAQNKKRLFLPAASLVRSSAGDVLNRRGIPVKHEDDHLSNSTGRP